MKKVLFVKALLCLFLNNINAQNESIIKGRILDSITKKPLEYATVLIRNNDSVYSGHIVTNKGKFSFKNVPHDKYILGASFIGYKKYTTSIDLNKNNPVIDLGNILLQIDGNTLQEVEITAEKDPIVNLVDRKIIDVNKDILSLGGSAIELLDNLPSVEVDIDGRLSFRGNNNVQLFLNGRSTNQTPEEVLRQTPVSIIEKIELITNPSAKYDPNGSSGIINIILKKEKNSGYNGSLRTSYTIGIKPKYSTSFSTNFRNRKVNISGFLSFYKSIFLSDRLFTRFNDNSIHFNDFQIDMLSQFGKIGIDYFVSDDHTISSSISLNRWDGELNNDTDIMQNNNPNISSRIVGKGDSSGTEYNVFYSGYFNAKKNNLKFEVSYETDQGNDTDDYKVQLYQEFTEESNDATKVYLDYTIKSNENSLLELGGAIEVKEQNQSFNSTLTDIPNLDHNYKRQINSLYAQITNKFGKLSVMVGLRGELVDEVGKSFQNSVYKNDYFQLYPSMFLTFNNKNHVFSIQYSRRIDRPPFNFVNPIRFYSTPTYISIGNIKLQPQFTNGVELSYGWRGEKINLNTSIYYKHIKDDIIRTLESSITDPNIIILSYDNLESNNSLGLETSLTHKFNNKLSTTVSFDYNRAQLSGFINDEDSTLPILFNKISHRFNQRTALSYNASKMLSFQTSVRFRNRRAFFQGEYKSRSRVDIGSSLKILKNKGRISLSIRDIFNNWDTNYTTEIPYKQEGINNIESQTFYIGFSYSFGKRGKRGKSANRKNHEDYESKSKELEIEQ